MPDPKPTQPGESPTQQLARMWTQSQPHVAAFIGSMVADFHDVEDLTQRVALAMADQLDQYDPSRSCVAWAIGIARFQVFNHYRRRGREKHIFDSSVLDQLAQAQIDLADELMDQREILAECLAQLPPKQSKLLNLRYVSGLGPAAIAEQLNQKTNAIHVALHRVRQALAKCVQDKWDANGLQRSHPFPKGQAHG